jgi:hypothetical protein
MIRKISTYVEKHVDNIFLPYHLESCPTELLPANAPAAAQP